MSELSRKKAIIKRAQQSAIAGYFSLDLQALLDLQSEYENTLSEILLLLEFYADESSILRFENLNQVRSEVERTLDVLADGQERLLLASIESSAALGGQTYLSELGSDLTQDVIKRTTRYVQNFTSEDGLQLSDRLWIVSDSMKRDVVTTINSAVIQGKSASEAAADLLAAGESPSQDILNKTRRTETNRLGNLLKTQFFDDASAYWQARRLFRTEINRAYGMAYQNSLEYDEDVAGTRFKLSPNHPRKDICDMHASANLHGLGRGVYPKNKNPWPAHPNTLSYVEVVFKDEISDEDRSGKQTAIEWLSNQPGAMRIGVLGVYRANLLANEQLATWMITSKVSNLKKRFGSS